MCFEHTLIFNIKSDEMESGIWYLGGCDLSHCSQPCNMIFAIKSS